MVRGVRKPPWLAQARMSGLFAVAMSLVLCAGAAAASSRRLHSIHPQRTQVISHSLRRREIAEHKRQNARWLRLTDSRKRSHAATDVPSNTPFQRGDVFMLGPGGVYEYSPVGTPVPNFSLDVGRLRQVIPASGATAECFDPSGKYLILPGAGLFDDLGNMLPSEWSTVSHAARCVADGLGHVYLSSGSGPDGNTGPWIVTEYNTAGNFIQSLNLSVRGFGPLAIDLGPDECTMYYTGWNLFSGISRFNVCTNTPVSTSHEQVLWDDLRVLPNSQVLAISDGSAGLYDPAGNPLKQWGASVFALDAGALRTVSLDPDGHSFWTGGLFVTQVAFDSTQASEQWAPTYNPLNSWPFGSYSPFIAVYGPPLLGGADLGSTVVSNAAGAAEAFATRVGYSGQLSRLHLWVDSSSTATQAVVGLYSNQNGHPGALLERATITNVMPGSWNYVDLPSMPVAAGQKYWIAALAPDGGGTLSLRDAGAGGTSQTAARPHLTTLPAHWSGAADAAAAGPLSAYGS